MSDTRPTRADDYLYALNGSEYEFFTGVDAQGSQLLFVVCYPRFVAVLFDENGHLVDSTIESLSESAVEAVNKIGFLNALHGRLGEEIDSWFTRRGFVKSPISVKRFYLPQLHIGIKDFPEYLDDIVQRPSDFSEDEQNVAQDVLRRWPLEGIFELWLSEGQNLTIDRLGNIESS